MRLISLTAYKGMLTNCVSGPVCVFSMKCSRSVQIKLKIPIPLFNQNITIIIIIISKHPRTITDLFSVLSIKYYVKNQTVIPNIINSDKDWAHCFNKFFCQMIVNIHDWFPSCTLLHGMPLVTGSCMSMMHSVWTVIL